MQHKELTHVHSKYFTRGYAALEGDIVFGEVAPGLLPYQWHFVLRKVGASSAVPAFNKSNKRVQITPVSRLLPEYYDTRTPLTPLPRPPPPQARTPSKPFDPSSHSLVPLWHRATLHVPRSSTAMVGRKKLHVPTPEEMDLSPSFSPPPLPPCPPSLPRLLPPRTRTLM